MTKKYRRYAACEYFFFHSTVKHPVPVAITGTEDIFEKHLPRVYPAEVIFEFGAPIDLKSLDKENRRHSGAYVRDIIIKMRERHQNMIAKQ